MNFNDIFKKSTKSIIRDSEKKIKNYQNELNQIKKINVEEVAIDMYSQLLPYYTIDYSKAIKMVNYIYKSNHYGHNNFEELFSSFGRNLDNFYNREDKILELEMLIHAEKEKIKEVNV